VFSLSRVKGFVSVFFYFAFLISCELCLTLIFMQQRKKQEKNKGKMGKY